MDKNKKLKQTYFYITFLVFTLLLTSAVVTNAQKPLSTIQTPTGFVTKWYCNEIFTYNSNNGKSKQQELDEKLIVLDWIYSKTTKYNYLLTDYMHDNSVFYNLELKHVTQGFNSGGWWTIRFVTPTKQTLDIVFDQEQDIFEIILYDTNDTIYTLSKFARMTRKEYEEIRNDFT